MFKISNFLPKTGKAKISAENPHDPRLFHMQWTRRATVQTGGQNYSLSSHQLPRYSLSGPLRLNARRINIATPAPPINKRQFSTVSVGATGLLNGQVFSQPLYNPDQGGFTASPFPINPSPFPHFQIQPAGAY